MPNFPIRFGKGQGLEVSAAQKTQPGLLELENAKVTERGVIEKRTGGAVPSLLRSSDPEDTIPLADLRAFWYRGNEGVLETRNEIYSRLVCNPDSGSPVTPGTATGPEISAALDGVESRSQVTQEITVTLPQDPNLTAVLARALRVDFPVSTMTGAVTWTVDELVGSPGLFGWTAFDGFVTVGPFPITSAAAPNVQQFLPRVEQHPSVGADVVITWVENNQLLAIRLDYTTITNIVTVDLGQVVSLRSTTGSQNRYEMRDGVVAAFNTGGSIGIFDVGSASLTPGTGLPTSVFYTVASTVVGTSNYDLDVSAPGGYGVRLAVSWASEADSLVRAAILDPGGGVPLIETSDDYRQQALTVRTGIEPSATADADRHIVALSRATFLSDPVWEFGPASETIMRLVSFGAEDMVIVATQNVLGSTYSMKTDVSDNGVIAQTTLVGSAGTADWHLEQRSDELYGILSLGTNEMLETKWRRRTDVTLASTGTASSTEFAVVQSAGRLGAVYFTDATTVLVRLFNDTDDVSANVTSIDLVVGGFVGYGSFPVAAAIVADVGGDDAQLRAHVWQVDGSLFTITLNTDTATFDKPRVDGTPEVPEFAIANAEGAAPRTMLGVQYTSGEREVYETNEDLFVRVSPPLTALPGGDWGNPQPWIRGQWRELAIGTFNAASVRTADAVRVLDKDGDPCLLVASEVDGIGVRAEIRSTHIEGNIVVDGTGTRPRLTDFSQLSSGLVVQGKAAFVYERQSTNSLFRAVWEPGATLSFSTMGITLATSPGVWDQTSGITGPTDVAYSIVVAIEVINRLRIVLHVSGGGTVDSFIPVTATFAPAVDVAVYAMENDGTNVARFAYAIVGDVGGAPTVEAGVFTIDVKDSILTAGFNRTHTLPDGNDVFAVSCSTPDFLDVECWIEQEIPALTPPNRRIEFWRLNAGAATEYATEIRRAVVATSHALVNGRRVGGLTLLGDDPLLRSGHFGYDPLTGQIVWRAGVGQTEQTPTVRDDRPPKNTLAFNGVETFTIAWQLEGVILNGVPTTNTLTRLVVWEWDISQRPNRPAVIDNTAVSAHAGYPRMYDGKLAHEHDWHELVELEDVVLVVGGGSLSAGDYTIAITWEDIDNQGLTYRSAPTFSEIITAGAGDRISVSFRPLTITERLDVVAVIWRTEAGGSAWHRDSVVAATLDGADVQGPVLLSIADSALRQRERLDQEPDGVLVSEGVPVTDFVAQAGGRLWSVDPRRLSLVRHSIPRREGWAVHWNRTQGVEVPEAESITAVGEMDGRIALMGPTTIAMTQGNGPDATGAGGFPTPSAIPVEIGAQSQASLALTPAGLVFGSADGPRLLSRGFAVVEIHEPVEKAWDGIAPIAIIYQPEKALLIVLDSGVPTDEPDSRRTMMWHTRTQRWAGASQWQALDGAVSKDGTRAGILTADGRVIELNESYSDGDLGYQTVVSTPWMRPPTSDRQTHPGFNVGYITVTGRFMDVHQLVVEVYLNFRSVPFTTGAVSQATTTQNYTAGVPYVYRFQLLGEHAYAARVRVRDDAEANQTWRIEAIDIDLRPVSGKPAEFPVEQLIPPVS